MSGIAKRIHENPSVGETPLSENILTAIRSRAERYPNDTIVERRREVGGWYRVSASTLVREVDEAARGLIGLGLRHGDSLVIMSRTRPEWTILDLAALSIGLIVVPIYESDSLAQIEWICENSNARMAVTDTHVRAQLIEQANTPTVTRILSFESGAMRSIQQAGQQVTDAQLQARQDEVDADCLATVIYTSGTTGKPKGVMLTHRNFVDTMKGLKQEYPQVMTSRNSRFLLFLPLAHVLARCAALTFLAGRGVFGYAPDAKNLLTDIQTFQPTILILVPRVLEKIYNAAEAKAGKGAKLKLFRWAATTSIEYSKAMETTLGPTAKQRRQLAWADKLVLRHIRKPMGPNMHYILSGGAPLSPTLGHFFRGAGFEVAEGWGLSEATGPLAITDLSDPVMGSVGRVLPGNAVALTDEGEILAKGASVFAGYFNDPQSTAEAFEDGWFKTGDKGSFDRKGNLYITGRIKDLLVTAGGKNVSPSVLEESLVTHPLISHVVVVGDQKPFIGALITLDQEMLPTWLANHGLKPMDVTEVATNPRVLESLGKAIKRANKSVSRAESIRKFRIINAEFSVDNGYLTPSMKLRRSKVTRDFAHEIEALYNAD